MKNNIFRKLGIHGDDDAENVEEEIISMVNEGHEQGVLHETEAEMITNIFEFGDKEAKDIMTNRGTMLAMDDQTTLADALTYMLDDNKSRFPVYHENVDHIIGILHFRDAVRFHRIPGNMEKTVSEIDGLMREAVFVPETKNIADLFRQMQRAKLQMVIVVDEYGQTLGLIAMEDILEEIVGNIMDEYDEEEKHIREGIQDEYVVEGITRLDELEEKFGISFSEQKFDTLNGFLIAKMDRIPEENEKFSVIVDGYEFAILSVKDRMIQTVRVRKVTEEKKEGED